MLLWYRILPISGADFLLTHKPSFDPLKTVLFASRIYTRNIEGFNKVIHARDFNVQEENKGWLCSESPLTTLFSLVLFLEIAGPSKCTFSLWYFRSSTQEQSFLQLNSRTLILLKHQLRSWCSRNLTVDSWKPNVRQCCVWICFKGEMMCFSLTCVIKWWWKRVL